MRIFCAFGKYQYGRSERGLSHEFQHFMPALKNLGHEVFIFDSWGLRHKGDLCALNRMLIEEFERFRADIFFSVHWDYEIWAETVDLIRRNCSNIVLVTWATDDTWKYERASRFWGLHYDVAVTTDPGSISKYRKDGIQHIFLSQWGVSSYMLQPPKFGRDCCYQLSFIGSATRDRREKIGKLRNAGIEIACFGNGWPGGVVNEEQLRNIINGSVISLNFNGSRGINQVKARNFEIPACGGFLLTEMAPYLDHYYKIGREIEVFADMDELVRKIKQYLTYHNERDEIAEAGYKRTLLEHTYESRFVELMEFVQKRRELRGPQDRCASIMSIEEECRRHKYNWYLRLLRVLLVAMLTALFGRKRGRRAARRLMFELSWRLAGERTYSVAGWVGRMFPAEY